jgi:hypothetical protein
MATMRHDILKGILCRAIHRAGVASTLEPTLHRLLCSEAEVCIYGAMGGTEAAGLEAHGDILLALESGKSVVDVSITHPAAVANRVAAAMTVSTAAARRDREKRRTYGQLEPNGYPFIRFSGETCGRLGEPAISFLGQLGKEAEEAGRKISKSGFVAAAIRELSVGVCQGNYQMYRASCWACLQGSPDVGSLRELLTPRRRCTHVVIGISVLICVACFGRVVLACVISSMCACVHHMWPL